jgi:hypothetical protein
MRLNRKQMKTIICVSVVLIGFAANVARANYLTTSQNNQCQMETTLSAQCSCIQSACDATYGASTQQDANCVDNNDENVTCASS